jgi:hypothetical protein
MPSARSTSSCFDANAIERAEAALESLSINFEEWMATEIERLDGARTNARGLAYSDASLETLFLRAHDVKGVGTTYGYPLITALGAQLCRLLDNPEGRRAAREMPALIDAHVDGMRAILRSNLRAADDRIGLALVGELKARVDRWATGE